MPTVTIQLSPEAQRRLAERARDRGLTLEEYLRQLAEHDAANGAPSKEHAPVPEPGEEEFKRRLVRQGLLKDVKPPVTDRTPYQDRRPFPIEGKPLSEAIIEERR